MLCAVAESPLSSPAATCASKRKAAVPSMASRKTFQEPCGLVLKQIPAPCQRSRMVPLHSLTSAAICVSGSLVSMGACSCSWGAASPARRGLVSSTWDPAGTSEETGCAGSNAAFWRLYSERSSWIALLLRSSREAAIGALTQERPQATVIATTVAFDQHLLE